MYSRISSSVGAKPAHPADGPSRGSAPIPARAISPAPARSGWPWPSWQVFVLHWVSLANALTILQRRITLHATGDAGTSTFPGRCHGSRCSRRQSGGRNDPICRSSVIAEALPSVVPEPACRKLCCRRTSMVPRQSFTRRHHRSQQSTRKPSSKLAIQTQPPPDAHEALSTRRLPTPTIRIQRASPHLPTSTIELESVLVAPEPAVDTTRLFRGHAARCSTTEPASMMKRGLLLAHVN
jgi:hypothetical protein